MSAKESGSASEILNELEAVVRHAKELQLALDRFTRSLELAVNEDHPHTQVASDVSFFADQLSDTGDAILVFAETINKDFDPLVKSLLSAGNAEKTAITTAKELSTTQISAIKVLGSISLQIAESSPPEKRPSPDTGDGFDVRTPENQSMTEQFHAYLRQKPPTKKSSCPQAHKPFRMGLREFWKGGMTQGWGMAKYLSTTNCRRATSSHDGEQWETPVWI
ncbi:hypothetical protein B0H34DRAFT_723272 [Crassisporium funariophilum]|nr:hypothetical protein B0H34DRAFT_723272 [Crassisporium funariophilum]